MWGSVGWPRVLGAQISQSSQRRHPAAGNTGEEGGTLLKLHCKASGAFSIGSLRNGLASLGGYSLVVSHAPLSSSQKGGRPRALGKALFGCLVMAQVAPLAQSPTHEWWALLPQQTPVPKQCSLTSTQIMCLGREAQVHGADGGRLIARCIRGRNHAKRQSARPWRAAGWLRQRLRT